MRWKDKIDLESRKSLPEEAVEEGIIEQEELRLLGRGGRGDFLSL